ncbi:6912_t:CDS:2 [Cetraspora pellucida]|uniref:6912_t:CDS:1 n=1 Tax=Cetraspora pellucida TaxID=1433469 RepID=A0A9N8W1Y0_9GLOM|nr:6912_t:CDS:2 [Cetraspora pellucida]
MNQVASMESKLPRVPNCCFFVPLRIGALIVSVWMLIWFAYTGVVVLLTSLGSSIAYTIFWKALGACYIILAVGAFYGAHAIYYQIPHRVATFVRVYLIAFIFYIVANIAFLVVVEIATSAALADAKARCEKAYQDAGQPIGNCDVYTNGVGYSIVGWIIPFIIGTLWQSNSELTPK